MREVAESDAIKDVLPAGEIFQQHFRGEITLGQRRDRRQNPSIAKRIRRRNLDHHLRRPVGARPHYAAVGADIAGLYAMGNLRPVGSTAEIGHRNGAECSGTGRRGGGKKTPAGKSAEIFTRDFNRHASLLDRPTGCAEALTDLGRLCDGSITPMPVYNVPVARNWAPARCRFCGMLISNALRSATALWNCSSAILKAVNAASSIAPCSKQCSVSRRIPSASVCIWSSSSMESLRRAAPSMSSNRSRSELLLLRSSFFR